MSQTTLRPGRAPAPTHTPSLPHVSIAWHPDLSRVGESLVVRGGLELGRHHEAFATGPLGDPYLSRRPLVLTAERNGLRLTVGGSTIRVDGHPAAAQLFSQAQLEAGVVLELADRVALLLHFGPVYTDGPTLGLVGPGLEDVRTQIRRVADLDVAVLVRGESGTGKERVARALHQQSNRKGGPFVAVSLAALTPSTAHAELFGHTRGAFTGASSARRGLFAAAHGGTLFLDEVGEAPPEVQVALLRVIETGEVQRLGADDTERVDVRIVAATDANLEDLVQRGAFREPLLHRLAGYELTLPPLRQRRQDIGPLLAHFLRIELDALGEADKLKLAGPGDDPFVGLDLAGPLLRAQYTGNVRQLRNAVRQLAIASRGQDRVVRTPAIERLIDETTTTPPSKTRLPDDDTVHQALRSHAYQPSAAARYMGVSKTWLYAWMDRKQFPKAGNLERAQVERAIREYGPDLEKVAHALEVSHRGLVLRMRELGLS